MADGNLAEGTNRSHVAKNCRTGGTRANPIGISGADWKAIRRAAPKVVLSSVSMP
jgi:hypothetical protein